MGVLIVWCRSSSEYVLMVMREKLPGWRIYSTSENSKTEMFSCLIRRLETDPNHVFMTGRFIENVNIKQQLFLPQLHLLCFFNNVFHVIRKFHFYVLFALEEE